ncbi:MAG: methyltransferase domain-containing protein, partial [Rhodospirillales bacterium]|nr:methyltransferase domain-containing protein [Rhodospirillales bacterium]
MAQDFAVARRNMVDGQLRPNQIVDPALLAALSSVPREAFVPADRAGIAYSDEAVPLGGGRALMEPMALARLIQIARPATGDAALVVGAGTGYGAAILSRLVATVVAVESDAALLARARAALAGAANVTLVEGALAEGGAAKGPYDLILVEGMIEAIPEAL